MKQYLNIAATMLGVNTKDLPLNVKEELDNVNRLIEKVDGGLVSRQIIAEVISRVLEKEIVNIKNKKYTTFIGTLFDTEKYINEQSELYEVEIITQIINPADYTVTTTMWLMPY